MIPKEMQPIHLKGKVIKEDNNTSFAKTEDKIQNYLNLKNEQARIGKLVDDDKVLEFLKTNNIYDVETGDMFTPSKELQAWASYLPNDVVVTVEPNKKPKFFKKLNDQNTHILEGMGKQKLETADLSGLFDSYPNIFSMDNPVANSRMYIINGKIVSAWALYYGPNSVKSPEDYAKNVDMVYNVPYVFSAFEIKAQLGLGAEMKVTAGEEISNGNDINLNTDEQWQLSEIEKGNYDNKGMENEGDTKPSDNTDTNPDMNKPQDKPDEVEKKKKDNSNQMLGQDAGTVGQTDNSQSKQTTQQDFKDNEMMGGQDPQSQGMQNGQMPMDGMTQESSEMEEKVKWTKWFIKKKINLTTNFRKKISFHTSVYGNAYIHLHRDEKGIVDKLTILQPERMKLYLDPLTTKVLFLVYLPPILGGTMIAAYPSANRLQDISMLNAPVLRFPSPVVIPVKDMIHFKVHDYTEYPFGFSELKSAVDICQARFDINLLAPYYFKKYCKTMLHVKYDNENAQGGKLEKKISDMKSELEDLEPGSDLITGPFWTVEAIGPGTGQSEIFALTNDLDEQLFAVTGVPITYFKPKGSTDRLVTNEDKVFLGKLRQEQETFIDQISRKIIIPAINEKFGLPNQGKEEGIQDSNDQMPMSVKGYDRNSKEEITEGVDKSGVTTTGVTKGDPNTNNDQNRENASDRTQERMYGTMVNEKLNSKNNNEAGKYENVNDKKPNDKFKKKKVETADFVTAYDVNNDPTFSTEDEYINDEEYEYENSYPKIEFGDITKTDLTQEIANSMVLLDKGIIDINRAAERVGEKPPSKDLQLQQQQMKMGMQQQGGMGGGSPNGKSVTPDGKEADSTMDSFVRMRGGLDMNKQNKNAKTDSTMNPEGKQKHRDNSPTK